MDWRARMNATLWRRLGKPLFIRDAFQFQILLCGTQGLWRELFRSASNNVVASYERQRNRRKGPEPRGTPVPPEGDAVARSARLGRRWLENLQDAEGAVVGDAGFDLWDTANAVLAMQKTGAPPSTIERSLSLLFSFQDEAGGVPVERDHYGKSYCIETTSMSLLAAHRSRGTMTEPISRGIDFLLGKQQAIGAWETPYLGIPASEVQVRVNYYPSNTGFALAPLLLIARERPSPGALARALRFLRMTQKEDGSWGTAISYCSVEGYATRNILPALRLLAGFPGPLNAEAGSMLSAAESFARRSQNPDGSWPSRGPTTKELATALMGRSLPMDRRDGTILGSVNWLLGRQKEDGSWDGGSVGGDSFDVLATSEAVSLLAEYASDTDVFYRTAA